MTGCTVISVNLVDLVAKFWEKEAVRQKMTIGASEC